MKRRQGLRWEWEPAGRSQGETGQRAVAREVRSGAFRLHKRDDQRRDSRKPITRPAAAAMPAVCHGEVWA